MAKLMAQTAIEDVYTRRDVEKFVGALLSLYIRGLRRVLARWRDENPIQLRCEVESEIIDAHRWPLWSTVYDLRRETENEKLAERLNLDLKTAIENINRARGGARVDWPSKILGEPTEQLERYYQLAHRSGLTKAHDNDQATHL